MLENGLDDPHQFVDWLLENRLLLAARGIRPRWLQQHRDDHEELVEQRLQHRLSVEIAEDNRQHRAGIQSYEALFCGILEIDRRFLRGNAEKWQCTDHSLIRIGIAHPRTYINQQGIVYRPYEESRLLVSLLRPASDDRRSTVRPAAGIGKRNR